MDSPEGELYDLADDPGEHRNLWHDPSCAARKEELLGVLRDWLIRSNLRSADRSAPWR